MTSFNVKNTSFEIVAEVESGAQPANGVIVAQGGRFGGWALHVKDGIPMYTYNYLGLTRSVAAGKSKLPGGKSTVKIDFAYEGGKKPGAGGTATLYVNGMSVGSTRIPKTEFAVFSADETAGVGVDMETTVSEEYDPEGSKFTGKIGKVAITLK
jgi:hypothetical protein